MSGELAAMPAAPLLAAAAIAALAGGGVRRAAMLLAPLLALALVWQAADGAIVGAHFLGYDLVLVAGDRLSRWFGTIFAVMSFAGSLYALNQPSRLEAAAALLYAGAALGVVFAGDLITVFIFWEVMALASTLVIVSAGDKAEAAALRYLLIHLFGGVLLMLGIAGHVQATGSTAFEVMQPDTLAHWLILAGFLVNAGAPPLSAWIPDAYPQASWSGMVVLSAFTTKTAVLVLMRGFPGTGILVWVGLWMMFQGIFHAILENDGRRLLAYAIVNQTGIMLIGIGIGSELALNGVASHAFASILYTALLVMAAGSVLLMTDKSKLTELGGLCRSMPLTTACALVGALTISAFPLTAGFVTKSMIVEAAAQGRLPLVWFALVAASAGAFLYAGLRFPWFVFFDRDSGLRPAEAPWNLRAAMLLLAGLCLLLGAAPGLPYAYLPFAADFVPYTGDHLLAQLQLLLFAGLAFFLARRWLQPHPGVTLDVDWFWRRLAPAAIRPLATGVAAAWQATREWFASGIAGALDRLDFLYRQGALSRQRPSSSMALIALAALAMYLLLHFAR